MKRVLTTFCCRHRLPGAGGRQQRCRRRRSRNSKNSRPRTLGLLHRGRPTPHLQASPGGRNVPYEVPYEVGDYRTRVALVQNVIDAVLKGFEACREGSISRKATGIFITFVTDSSLRSAATPACDCTELLERSFVCRCFTLTVCCHTWVVFLCARAHARTRHNPL